MNPESYANLLLEAAYVYAGRGWRVFPLVPGDKRPAIKDWERTATTSLDTIGAWWGREPYGIGIATGPSGLVVIDLDVPKPGVVMDEFAPVDGQDTLTQLATKAGQPVPWGTYITATPSGGTHLVFRSPAGARLRNTSRHLGPFVDTRAGGGYVVAAPTALHAGEPYRVLNDVRPLVLPDWLAVALQPPARITAPPDAGRAKSGRGNAQRADGRTHPYLARVITDQCTRISTAASGGRNHALFISAVVLGRFVGGGELTEQHAVEVLAQAVEAHIGRDGFTRAEAESTIRSGLAAGAQRPRTIPARPSELRATGDAA